MPDETPEGKIAFVSETIRPGQSGEVSVKIRGGTEAFTAYSIDSTEEIPKGSRAFVHEFFAPRTVIVQRVNT